MVLGPVFSSKSAETPSWFSKAGESKTDMPGSGLFRGETCARVYARPFAGTTQNDRSAAPFRRRRDRRRAGRQRRRRAEDEALDVADHHRPLIVPRHHVIAP